MQFDLPLEELRTHRPDLPRPDDFDAFWDASLAATREHPLDLRRERVDLGYDPVETYDVTFSGFAGDPIRAWLRIPAGADGPLPGVVQFHGYHGGRGLAHEPQMWPLAGFAHLSVDTRGQGGGNWTVGDTPDPHGGSGPEADGWLTRGILSPETAYYRRVFCDAARAVEALRAVDGVDPQRVVVTGGSQGGGIALAAASLVPDVAGVASSVPYLCDFREALMLSDATSLGYGEIIAFLRTHGEHQEAVLRTLSYLDVANLVTRATSPALFSVGLMDTVCPPRTVFAAYNRYGGSAKDMVVFDYSAHEGGGPRHLWTELEWARGLVAR
ncbi:acetylxylan esterase [Pseudolysinimonas sp.]|uniref:acetylxylan esterase n=1 Tax=Pseudolysinimonas sp. TaxID=2680009 RepID=UPI003F7DEE10